MGATRDMIIDGGKVNQNEKKILVIFLEERVTFFLYIEVMGLDPR
jgi:hypothetical protein